MRPADDRPVGERPASDRPASDRPASDIEKFDEQIRRIVALGEPVRRTLYRYVIEQAEPVDRDRVAAATGIARHTVKFHLDRLEADGLLEADYSRPSGRRGPGAGRPAKRYWRSTREVSVSLPERRYDLAMSIMADAIATANQSGTRIADALHDAATVEGRELGAKAQARRGGDPSATAAVGAVREVLAECGYEPSTTDGTITMANCPFHRAAERHPDLVCAMNLDIIRGLLEVCDHSGLEAELRPSPGRCCVTLRGAGSAQRDTEPSRA
jgi:predicted ArsR family transcriptional regulator